MSGIPLLSCDPDTLIGNSARSKQETGCAFRQIAALPSDHLDFHADVGTAPSLIRSQSGNAEFSRECKAGAIPKRKAEGSRGGPEMAGCVGLDRGERADIEVKATASFDKYVSTDFAVPASLMLSISSRSRT